MIRRWGTLSQRLSLVFAVLLLVCCGASAWLQMRANSRYEQELTQRLSAGLATHIASNAELMRADGLNDTAVRDLFGKLMAVNPSVEVYLLTPTGRIAAQAAPPGHLKAQAVDLRPIQQLLSGAELPVLGDDPRSATGQRKVFSAARLQVQGHDAGYVYVVLQGENFAALAARVSADNILRTTLLSMGLVALLCLVAGLAAFALITRPLRRLTVAVRRFEAEGVAAFDRAEPPLLLTDTHGAGQDVAALGNAFTRMAQRIAMQWRELTEQDQQRRELFANISHDLRTPLTSLHGYLETLLIKSEMLNPQDRRRYLEIALDQSRKVGRLAQELFDLARLEYGVVKLEKEPLALPDLVQDVFQKFELAAQARRQRLVADIAPGLPTITADLGLIERVLTNLLDNAIQHTPEGGEITVQLRVAAARSNTREESGVAVEISDTGPGVSPALHPGLFKRPAFNAVDGRGGGLGLVVVQRILALHGSDIALVERSGKGAVFAFRLR